MKPAMMTLALNLFSLTCLLISGFLVLCDQWQWVVFFLAAVAFVHGVKDKEDKS